MKQTPTKQNWIERVSGSFEGDLDFGEILGLGRAIGAGAEVTVATNEEKTMAQLYPGFGIAIAVHADADGGYVCEAISSPPIETELPTRFCGQTPSHAIANALENLACVFRMQAGLEQHIGWESVDHSSSGQVIEKRFHVIVHYEEVVEEESKFEAMVATQLGNTIVENADFTLI